MDGIRLWLPLIFGATAYVSLLASGNHLLNDSDVYWHIAVGQWMLDHRAVPHADPFSFTMYGAPWITSEWLSEILYLGAFKAAGWAGPVILAAASIAAAFVLLTRLLLKTLPNIPVMILVGAAMAMTAAHSLARPHVLVFPLLVLWGHAIVRAAEERGAPSVAYLPVIWLWANLHGSFTLGLALIAPFALEAVVVSEKSARVAVAVQWLCFTLLAVGAACITPYGFKSFIVTFRILGLGSILSTISEWQPLDFASLGIVQVCLLAGIGYVLYSGFRLSPLRILVVLAIVHETLAHRRYVDVLGLFGPLVVAGPLAKHLSYHPPQREPSLTAGMRAAFVAAVAALLGATCVAERVAGFAPQSTPLAALERARQANVGRILNDYEFGGFLIRSDIPTFIDSRAELFGAEFITRYQQAVSLNDSSDFVRMLDQYQIGATLLSPKTPAVGLLDRMEGWQRIYGDSVAVVHIRRAEAGASKP
ncbi:hypothetical protein JQ586_37760 [Bradyrhizobium jicamae]|nr:hypothetical protein [Bradyrhizobium jicamae]